MEALLQNQKLQTWRTCSGRMIVPNIYIVFRRLFKGNQNYQAAHHKKDIYQHFKNAIVLACQGDGLDVIIALGEIIKEYDLNSGSPKPFVQGNLNISDIIVPQSNYEKRLFEFIDNINTNKEIKKTRKQVFEEMGGPEIYQKYKSAFDAMMTQSLDAR